MMQLAHMMTNWRARLGKRPVKESSENIRFFYEMAPLLGKREFAILHARFLEQKTRAEIGKAFDVTAQRIMRIENKAWGKLKALGEYYRLQHNGKKNEFWDKNDPF